MSDGYLGFCRRRGTLRQPGARSIAPARMTGNWGGELMRGVRAFKFDVPRGGFIAPQLVEQMKESAQAFSTKEWHPLSAALFQQMPFQGYGRNAIERSQLVMRSPFLADDIVSLLYRAPASVREVHGLRNSRDRTEAGAAFYPDRPRVAWRAVVRNRPGCSENGVKAEYSTSHGAPDWLARLSAHLPPSLLETRFLGVDKFQHFRHWARHDLARCIRETLSNEQPGNLAAWFDMRRVGAMVEEHVAGRANYTDQLDKMMTLSLAGKTLFSRVQVDPGDEAKRITAVLYLEAANLLSAAPLQGLEADSNSNPAFQLRRRGCRQRRPPALGSRRPGVRAARLHKGDLLLRTRATSHSRETARFGTRSGNLVAFIDDDECPVGDWLAQLFKTLKRYGADGVLGPVVPDFPTAAPAWLKKGRVFERQRRRDRHSHFAGGCQDRKRPASEVAVPRRTAVVRSGLRPNRRGGHRLLRASV